MSDSLNSSAIGDAFEIARKYKERADVAERAADKFSKAAQDVIDLAKEATGMSDREAAPRNNRLTECLDIGEVKVDVDTKNTDNSPLANDCLTREENLYLKQLLKQREVAQNYIDSYAGFLTLVHKLESNDKIEEDGRIIRGKSSSSDAQT